MQRLPKFLCVLLASLLLACPLLHAQETGAIEDGDLEVLEALEARGVPIEESVLPTTRPFDSVYGMDRSILATPRNVTIISREQLDAINIFDVRDFSKLTSSSYGTSNFGAPTTPSLRGQIADTFYNGMRRGLTSNGNGLPVNFNAVESVNIVKGPPSVIHGYSQYRGGYVDYVTKDPYFDEFRGEASVTVGMYEQYRWQLDLGGPIDEELAYRVSYSGEQSDSFYDRGKRNTQAIFGALTWNPEGPYRLELNAEFFVADYTENFGINRPTQDLIDDGLYYPNAQTDAEYRDYVEGVGGFSNYVPLGEPVEIDRSKRLLAPGDDSFGKQFSAQAIQTWESSADLRIVNNTAFNWIDRDTFSSYHYSEVLKDNWSLDNRTEFIGNLADKVEFNTGVHLRYQRIEAYNHFGVEPANAFDLTRDPDLIRVPDSAFANTFSPEGTFGFTAEVPGEEARGILDARYYQPFNGDSGESEGFSIGPYFQADFQATEKLSVLAGLRVDYIWIDFQNLFDPSIEDEDFGGLDNYNVSVVYEILENLSVYGTYNFSESTGTGNGGGFVPGDGMEFDDSFLDQESELWEAGLKGSFLDDSLFASIAVFTRDFAVPGSGGAPDSTFDSTGFEFEMNYQPNRNFYATFSYSYIDTRSTDSFASSSFPIDQHDNFPDLVPTPTFSAILPLPGDDDIEVPASPDHQFNGLAAYTFDNGFGFSANFILTSPFYIGYNGLTNLGVDPFGVVGTPENIAPNNAPETDWQYTIDLAAFYETDRFLAKVSVFNVTDEENWSPSNPVYGFGGLVADPPVRVEGTFTYKF